jgi:hypothetical protein
MHWAGDALLVVITPARVPEMETERTVAERCEDMWENLNYNVGHSRILLEAYLTCSIT